MQSKTSFFNKTVFKKNLTRFAPVWVGYGLMLCIYFIMLYSNQVESDSNNYGKLLGFASSIVHVTTSETMVLNLGYALLTAQLLFGDLYNSRMCNALHAMPLRREEWFVTNGLSALAFSAIPTMVAVVVLVPLLSVSIVENAWLLAVLWFFISNLQFICCFGLAAFAAMCVGSRLTMAAGYGLLQFGAWIAYWLVDTVYTPMLYGVITPTTLASNLTPAVHMVNYDYVTIEDMIHEYELVEKGLSLADMTLSFALTEHWWRLFAMAGVGILFAGLALLLYRKRDLECAGDAVAFPILKPVFQVLCALFVMCAGQFVVTFMLGMQKFGIPIMAICLVAGWFIGKMMLERSTRVFRPKNWYGLGILAACMALTLAATHFDILNIEQRLPDLDKVKHVQFETNQTISFEVKEDQWEDVRRIHELAFTDRVENQGLYRIEPDGSRIRYTSDSVYAMDIKTGESGGQTLADLEHLLGYEEFVQAGNVRITYEFENGSTMTRRYNIWSDGEIGNLTRKTLSSWENLTYEKTEVDGELVPVIDAVLADFRHMNVNYASKGNSILEDREMALSFLEAVKRDAEAGLMLEDGNFHRGVFAKEITDEYYGETYLDIRDSIYVNIEGFRIGWNVRIYPDCVNTMNWLIDRGLIDYTVFPDALMLPG